jgi:hypothetical protein
MTGLAHGATEYVTWILAFQRASVMAHKTRTFNKTVIHHKIFDKSSGSVAYVARPGYFYMPGRHSQGTTVVMAIIAAFRQFFIKSGLMTLLTIQQIMITG